MLQDGIFKYKSENAKEYKMQEVTENWIKNYIQNNEKRLDHSDNELADIKKTIKAPSMQA